MYRNLRQVVILREPYRHTRSVWHMTCGRFYTRERCPSFADWINAFLSAYHKNMNKTNTSMPTKARFRSWGHAPIEYQRFFLQAKLHKEQRVQPDPGPPEQLVAETAHLIGVTELIHESLCVMHGLLAMEGTGEANSTLPDGCDCRDMARWGQFSMTHDDAKNSHGVNHTGDKELLQSQENL